MVAGSSRQPRRFRSPRRRSAPAVLPPAAHWPCLRAGSTAHWRVHRGSRTCPRRRSSRARTAGPCALCGSDLSLPDIQSCHGSIDQHHLDSLGPPTGDQVATATSTSLLRHVHGPTQRQCHFFHAHTHADRTEAPRVHDPARIESSPHRLRLSRCLLEPLIARRRARPDGARLRRRCRRRRAAWRLPSSLTAPAGARSVRPLQG